MMDRIMLATHCFTMCYQRRLLCGGGGEAGPGLPASVFQAQTGQSLRCCYTGWVYSFFSSFCAASFTFQYDLVFGS